MAWTNKGLQGVIDTYGDRMNSISLNNGKYLFIGYQSGIKLTDISLETIGGVDVIKVHHKANQGGREIEWDDLITTEFIEGIDIISEKDKDFRLDPIILK